MIVNDNLLTMSNILFRNREDFKKLTPEQRKKWGFMINRMLSKSYPEKSELLNNKGLCDAVVYDTWFGFFKDKSIPSNYWSKSNKKKSVKSITLDQRRWLILVNNLDKEEDLDFLIENYPKEIKEELKRYNARKN